MCSTTGRSSSVAMTSFTRFVLVVAVIAAFLGSLLYPLGPIRILSGQEPALASLILVELRLPRALRLAWSRRDAAFTRELHQRNDALTACIDAGDDEASILAELDLHGYVYEASGHRLLQRTWQSLRGRLQLYWAAHHRAHGTRGPRRDSHDSYVKTALGDNLGAMLEEVSSHMGRGAEQTAKFLQIALPSSSAVPSFPNSVSPFVSPSTPPQTQEN